jgi:rfaE bifunctional protein kinase chain/domain
MAGFSPLDADGLEAILRRIPTLTIGVLGDLFLDRYLDLDAALTEPSLETGLDAYQVVNVRPSPGAAGTVINNLVALGVGRVCPIAVIGDDGEGYELRQVLGRQPVVDTRGLIIAPDRRTPTYTKPMLHEKGMPAHELNRLDIKNRLPMPPALEEQIQRNLAEFWPQLDALVVLDQVSESICGVLTAGVRSHLHDLTATAPDKFVLADSRERIGLFRGVCLKPNRQEVLKAVGLPKDDGDDALERATSEMARRADGWVFCTDGAQGIVLASPHDDSASARTRIPAYPVSGPIDIVGAGDSTSAGIVCAMAGGATVETAATFGNLVASITIQQLGTTGTATPEQVRQRWRELGGCLEPPNHLGLAGNVKLT